MKSLSFLFTLFSLIILMGAIAHAVPPEGLVLYLTFEDQGDKVTDLSPEHNDGTIQGAQQVKGQDGFGSALQFSPGDFVEIPHSASLSITDAITVMAWTNTRVGGSGEMGIVSKGQWAANDLPYELTETPGGVIFWQFYDNAGRDGCQPPSPPSGEWHHIAGTYDGKEFIGYVDGEEQARWAYAGKMPQNTANVTIGKRSETNDTFFDGLIDEVAIFHRVLAADEIKASMQGIATSVDALGKLTTTWARLKVTN